MRKVPFYFGRGAYYSNPDETLPNNRGGPQKIISAKGSIHPKRQNFIADTTCKIQRQCKSILQTTH